MGDSAATWCDGHDEYMELIGGLFVVAVWLVPFVLVAFLFRTLGTIVEGLRSINLGVQRTAAAVEALAARQQVQAPSAVPPSER